MIAAMGLSYAESRLLTNPALAEDVAAAEAVRRG